MVAKCFQLSGEQKGCPGCTGRSLWGWLSIWKSGTTLFSSLVPHDVRPSCEQENISSPWKAVWSQRTRREWGRLTKGKSLGCLWNDQVEFINGNFTVNFFMDAGEAALGKPGNLASGFH